MLLDENERELRRLRREERREKQRAANAGRAARMHSARLAWEASLLQINRKPPPALQVGCSGWFYWHWKGLFYPEEMSTKDWFSHYAARFRTVELNAPFYSWPTVATVQSWLRLAGGRKFIYTIKVSELITHTKRFDGTEILVRDFGHIADLLGDSFGCFLFQLPPSVHYSAPFLRKILSQLDPARRNVVEFRHKSWWNEKVYSAFRKAGAIFCSCSGPRLPDALVKTADDIYLRFHGTKTWYRHDYTREELEVWAERARLSGAKRIWAYFNNDRNGHAIANAGMLRRMLAPK